MRKNLFKKVTALALALTMVVGSTNIVSAAHAANGANVAGTASWDWFSVCDGQVTNRPTTEWERNLMAIPQVYGKDYATAGYLTQRNSSSCNLYVVNSGWDGEYSGEVLTGDNPYGLQILCNNINIEKNRYYTVTFKIKSTLTGSLVVYRDANNDYYTSNGTFYKDGGKDNTTDDTEAGADFNKTEDQVKALVEAGTLTEDTKKVTTKKVVFQATSMKGGSALEFSEEPTGCVSDGGIILDSANENGTSVKATFKVPNAFAGNVLRLVFNCGSFIVSRPNEIAMKGNITVSDLKVTAGVQHKVTFYDGSVAKYSSYVNDGEAVPSLYSVTKKGYTLNGYTLNGATYYNAPIRSDAKLIAKWVKTPKPSKGNVKAKSSSKKKVKVTFRKNKNARGYQVQYSTSKKFKKSKTKTKTTSSTTSYTIKKLKSGKIYYVRARAYNLDSTGSKVYGKYGSRKMVLVK